MHNVGRNLDNDDDARVDELFSPEVLTLAGFIFIPLEPTMNPRNSTSCT
jgi:hypothetical protein